MNQDRERLYFLEKQIADLTDVSSSAVVTVAADDPSNMSGGSTSARLETARAELQRLLQKYTAAHPQVKRMQTTVKELEARAQSEALEQPVSPSAQRPSSPEEARRQASLKQFQLEREGLLRQIAMLQSEEQRLRGVTTGYQGRLETTAIRESELASLTRDNETIRKQYDQLLAKQQDSRVAANMEHMQFGAQFRTLEPPRMPEKPFNPNRPLIILVGAVVGLGLGLGAVASLEYKDNSLRSEEEVNALLSLPVLAVIPMMLSGKERRKRRRQKFLLSIGATLLLFVSCAGAAWFFLFYR